MKVKKIHIEIKTLDGALKEAAESFEKISQGQRVKGKTALYFSNIRDLRKVLTEKRLELLKTVKDRKPSSIYELARMVDRDLKNVLQDVGYLQEIGMIDIAETKDKKIPTVGYDVLSLEVAI
jgi:predicted transcriptional regulator